jgi:hypothetical protein
MYIKNHSRLDFVTEVNGKAGLYPMEMEGLFSKYMGPKQMKGIAAGVYGYGTRGSPTSALDNTP